MTTSTAAARPASDHRPDWRDDAACRDADPDLFFPDGGIGSTRDQVKTAKLICRGCPVSTTCLSWALSSSQEHGIWGGLTEDERRRLHRRSRAWTAGRWAVLSAHHLTRTSPAPAPMSGSCV
jgi:WhiB family redox-sensing transcriptional regulator